MADDVLASFLVALGFKVDTASQQAATKSVAEYEKAVKDAEKRIEDAKWAAAQTDEEIAKLARETNLKLAREALEGAKAREKAEQEQARKRKENNAAFIAGLEKAAIAAAAAAAAIGYAVAKVAGAFDSLYFQAQRSGTSVQSLKALGYAFCQTGGSAQQATAAVDSFTTALRNNPGLRQFVSDLGVDDKLQGVDKLLATVEALNKEPQEIAVQHAGMLGISETDYNLLRRQMEAVKAYRAEYDETAKRFGLNSEQAATASTSFQRALTRLQATAGVLTEKLMASLAPAIQGLIDRFQAWVDANPGVLDKILTDIAKAVVSVAEGIGRLLSQMAGDNGEAFLKKWDAFVERAERFAKTVERIVYGVERLLKLLHLVSKTDTALGSSDRTIAALNAISGGTAAPNGPGGINAGNVVPPDDRTFLQKVLPKSMGGKDAPQAGDGSRSWRNNNPGNLKYSPFTQKMGATGKDEKGFAKFPDYSTGRKAQEELLFRDERYKNLSIKDAVAKYAPSSDGNEPAAYAETIAQAAGVSVDTQLSALTADQRARLLDAQQTKEGWIPGKPSPVIGDGVNAAIRGSANYMHGQFGAPGENLTSIKLESGKTVTVHKEAAESFRGFLNELESAGYNIDSVGGYNNRSIRGSNRLSQHAYGNAIDINPAKNPMTSGPLVTDLPNNVSDMAAKYGLTWGGDWKNRKDAMHFEWAGIRPVPTSGGEKPANRPEEAPAPKPMPATTRMDPGGFDMSKIDPHAVIKPAAPMGTGNVNNTSSSDNRAVHQTINNNVKIEGSNNPREHGRVIESSLSRIHGLALANAQSAVA